MSKKQKYDWSVLLQEFTDSGLTQARFCVECHINAKYFSLRRAKLLKEKQPAFVRAKISPSPNSHRAKQQTLLLKFPHAELRFDTSIDPLYVSQLIKASSWSNDLIRLISICTESRLIFAKPSTISVLSSKMWWNYHPLSVPSLFFAIKIGVNWKSFIGRIQALCFGKSA